MKKVFSNALCVLLGIVTLFSLLCSVTAGTVLNAPLLSEGFQALPAEDHGHIAAFGVDRTQYAEYAQSLVTYLSGKGDTATVLRDGAEQDAFRDAENRQNEHLKDVRSLTLFLVYARYIGCGSAVLSVAAVALWCYRKKRAFPASAILTGFARAGAVLLLLAAALCVWAAADFSGLFLIFHRVVFAGSDTWMLDWRSHLLMAFMPQAFFEYCGKKLLVALLPILGIMLFLIVADVKLGKQEKKKKN